MLETFATNKPTTIPGLSELREVRDTAAPGQLRATLIHPTCRYGRMLAFSIVSAAPADVTPVASAEPGPRGRPFEEKSPSNEA